MLNKLKLNNMFLFTIFIEVILMILIVYFLQTNIKYYEELSESEYQRFQMNKKVNELYQSSDDLTRFARSYVITKNIKYKENYYEILNIKNGLAPRPRYYDTIYWDYLESNRSRLKPGDKAQSIETLLNQFSYTPTERKKINKALEKSKDLIKLEIESFNIMEGLSKDENNNYIIKSKPNQNLAIKLLFSKKYYIKKQEAMQPINEFNLLLNDRTTVLVNNLKKNVKKNTILLKIFITSFIIINILIFCILHRHIIKIITYITNKIKEAKNENGNIKFLKIKYEDELGMLIHEFNSMQTIISQNTRVLKYTNEKLLKQREVINEYIIISETDLKGNITEASEAFCKISGYSKNELIGKNHKIISHEDTPIEIYKEIQDCLKNGQKWEGQLKNKKKNGEEYWVKAFIEPIWTKYGDKVGYRSIRIDITDKKRIEKLSVTDKLTGLYNRLKLDEVFEYEIRRTERYNEELSMLMIDIDKFKNVNDIYGHQTGDKVLIEFSKILAENIRKVDTLGRWGGEEFVIISPKTNINNAKILAEKLRKLIEKYNFPKIDKLTASFGVTTYKNNDSKESIINRADKALYEAKENGRNKFVVLE